MKPNLATYCNIELQADGVVVYRTHNVSTTGGRELIMEAITDNTRPDIQIKYLAIGDGAVNIVQSNTALANEVTRFRILEPIILTNNQRQYIIPIGRLTYPITEVGLYMGADATQALGSGTLFNHATFEFNPPTTGQTPFLNAIITIGIRDGV